MKAVDNVSLSVVRETDERTMTEGAYEVCIDGVKTGITVPVKVLEAAVKVDADRYLLFLTDDVPYEEALHIVLLHRKTGILEKLFLGGPYLTGSFADMCVSTDAVTFSFMGDTTWKVEVPEKPFLQLPFIGDPRGISRPFGLQHFIKISADPPPARADGRR